MSEVAYRRDIDGLRAVAVLAVVAFHADIHFFSGGYVGVDVFFVISGFLIGSMLLKQIDSGRFSIAEFYKRRVLRIAPALFLLFFVLLLLLPMLLFPVGMFQFIQSLRAALLSVSNFYFESHTNYFADPYGKPLLHTWSLAVEEQFYLVLPLLLLALRRAGSRARLIVLLALFAVSAVVSTLWVRADQNGAFYSPVSRCWELLLGTLLTFLAPLRGRLPRLAREITLGLGLTLILASVHFYSSKTHFPGLAAAIPCSGAALLILFGGKGEDAFVSRLLCLPPVVFLGMISYSLYLWHWPVIVLIKMGAIPHLPYHHRSQTLLIASASLVLAVLSWRYVETPFRTKALRTLPPARVLQGFAGASVALLLLSVVSSLVPSPFSTEALAMAKYVDQVDNEGYRKGICYVGDPYSFADFHGDQCLALDPRRPNVLVLGDSHAAADYPGLNQAFPEVNFLQATNQGCKPLRKPGYSADCDRLLHIIFDQFLPAHHIDRVLLIGRWLELSDISDLDQTVNYLRTIGQDPILFGPAPEYQMSLPRLIAYSISRHDPSLPDRFQTNEQFSLDTVFRAHAEQLHLPYVSPITLLCRERRCPYLITTSPRVPLLFDSNHFTEEGSLLLAERLRQADPHLLIGAQTGPGHTVLAQRAEAIQ